jgi:hypothetical protein
VNRQLVNLLGLIWVGGGGILFIVCPREVLALFFNKPITPTKIKAMRWFGAFAIVAAVIGYLSPK